MTKLKRSDAKMVKKLGNMEMSIKPERAREMFDMCFTKEEQDEITSVVLAAYKNIGVGDIVTMDSVYVVPDRGPQYWYGHLPVAHCFEKEISAYRIYKNKRYKFKDLFARTGLMQSRFKEAFGGTPEVTAVVGAAYSGHWPNRTRSIEGIGIVIQGTTFADVTTISNQRAYAARWKKDVDSKLAYYQLLSSELGKIVPDEVET